MKHSAALSLGYVIPLWVFSTLCDFSRKGWEGSELA